MHRPAVPRCTASSVTYDGWTLARGGRPFWHEECTPKKARNIHKKNRRLQPKTEKKNINITKRVVVFLAGNTPRDANAEKTIRVPPDTITLTQSLYLFPTCTLVSMDIL